MLVTMLPASPENQMVWGLLPVHWPMVTVSRGPGGGLVVGALVEGALVEGAVVVGALVGGAAVVLVVVDRRVEVGGAADLEGPLHPAKTTKRIEAVQSDTRSLFVVRCD